MIDAWLENRFEGAGPGEAGNKDPYRGPPSFLVAASGEEGVQCLGNPVPCPLQIGDL